MIGIIFIGSVKVCPYMKRYVEILDELGENYEVIYWNRSSDETVFPANYISFDNNAKITDSGLKKVFDFYKFFIWVNKEVRRKKYKKLILLSTLSAFVLFPRLIFSYKRKYIFDIRDYSYESNIIFYVIEKLIIQKSALTTISSQGFKNFLPKGFHYIRTDNFNPKDVDYSKEFKQKKYGETLNIVWLGSVRYFNHQKKLMDLLGNDNRYRIYYHGSGPELDKFIEYCKVKLYDNIYFTGTYDDSIKRDLLSNADIINNSYGQSNEQSLKHAVSNKYYDGLIFGIPQLVEENSYKEELLSNNNLGIAIDLEKKELGDILYKYYYSIDEKDFNRNKSEELWKILKYDKIFKKHITQFLKEN